MRLSIAVSLGALSAICAADSLEVYQRCRYTDHCEGLGFFKTAYGETEVNGNNGCHKTKVPYLEEFCIDVPRGRAHFRFQGQNKRCLFVVRTEEKPCSFPRCITHFFEEITCSWKMAPSATKQDDGALPFTLSDGER